MSQARNTETPLAPLAPGEHRYLAIDGACLPSGMRRLHDLGVNDTPALILADGAHDALAPLGPLLFPLDDGGDLAGHWGNRHPALARAVALHTAMTLEELTGFFRARVQVRLPDDRVTWLRLADATVVARLATAEALLPATFWHRVTHLSYHTGPSAVHHYRPTVQRQDSPEVPRIDGTAVIQPRFRFSEPLVHALSNPREKTPDTPHTEVL